MGVTDDFENLTLIITSLSPCMKIALDNSGTFGDISICQRFYDNLISNDSTLLTAYVSCKLKFLLKKAFAITLQLFIGSGVS